MATTIARFTANNTWQSVASGAGTFTINPENGYGHMAINTSLPAANTNDYFLVKPVAGENYLTIELAGGDNIYLRSLGERTFTVSWIKSA